MRGETARAFESEPLANASQFERSLQTLLNNGSAKECLSAKCRYLPHVNSNSFFTDVNGDGLPDLITATPPQRWKDGNSPLITCLDGHDVYLNRGYAFESAQGETLPGQRWAVSSELGSALRLVANRDRKCESVRPRITDSSERPNPFQDPARPNFPIAAMTQADVNADGRVDIVIAYQPDWNRADADQRIYLNTGRGFSLSDAVVLPRDLAIARNIPYPVDIDPSLAGWPRAGSADTARFVDLDNDGLVDIVNAGLCVQTNALTHDCRPARWYRNAGTIPDKLERIDSSTGAWTQIEYESPKSAIVQLPEDGLRPPASMRVVKSIRSASGPVPTPSGYDPFPVQEVRLSYENFVKDALSNEVVGFEKVHAYFINSFDGAERETVHVAQTFDVQPVMYGTGGTALPVRHPLKGTIVSTITESDGWVATESHQYSVDLLGAGIRIRSYRDYHGDTAPSGKMAWSAEETAGFDEFGNPTKRVTGNLDGASIGPAQERRITVTEYENRSSGTPGLWQIGLVTRQQTIGYSEDIDGTVDSSHVLSEQAFAYDAKGGLISKARVGIRGEFCDGPSSDLTTYTYSPNGLVRGMKEANGRETKTTYDPTSLYPVQIETRVGRMEGGSFVPAVTLLQARFQTDLATGKRTAETEPNGSTTTSTYDTKGRLISRRRARQYRSRAKCL